MKHLSVLIFCVLLLTGCNQNGSEKLANISQESNVSMEIFNIPQQPNIPAPRSPSTTTNDRGNYITHCEINEEILFNFEIKDNEKILSICTDEQLNFLVYRFGKPGNIELEFPKDKKDSLGHFTYGNYFRGGGVQNAGLDLNSLFFHIGEYTYEVYDDYSAEEDQFSVGVKVKNSDDKVIVIEGLDRTKIGGLVGLRRSGIEEAPM